MRTRPISDDEIPQHDAAVLKDRLRAEQAAREATERQLVALQTEKRALEHRVINANRTLAHGLGRALIEARSLKGIIALPGRLRRLRLKQKVKRRERVPNSFADDVAESLRLVDPAFDHAMEDGVQAAADWVRGQNAGTETKARAFAELALWVIEDDPALAAKLGKEAAALAPGEQRLLALVNRLRDKGLVAAPAALCSAIRDHQPLSQPQKLLCDHLIEDAALLESGVWGSDSELANSGEERAAGLAILCPPRWMGLPRIAAARDAASSKGLPVTVTTPADHPDFTDISIVHIFADSLAMACSATVAAREAGCRVILDLANPPPASIALLGSELAAVETARLKGLAASTDALITRSQAMATHLQALDIVHQIVGEGQNHWAQNPDDQAIAAALLEYGAKPDALTLACIATLDEDQGVSACVEAFAALVAAGDAEQFLIVGKGDHVGSIARKAEQLGIGENTHFIGLPPPQRWPALLASLRLAIFPRRQAEALGSEIPLLLAQAIAAQTPILASDAQWNAQAESQLNEGAQLAPNGDWVADMRNKLSSGTSGTKATSIDEPLLTLYETFTKTL